MKIFKSQFNKIQTYFFKYFQFPVPVPRLPIKNYLSCVFTSFAVKCFRNKHWFKKSKTAADNKKNPRSENTATYSAVIFYSYTGVAII